MLIRLIAKNNASKQENQKEIKDAPDITETFHFKHSNFQNKLTKINCII